MSYKENQRKKAISIRDEFFKDPGNGYFAGKDREFVLSEPAVNLWAGIREDAIAYFRDKKITWWKGEEDEPTGHLLSSQVACLNHLYFLRQRQDAASTLLRGIDPMLETAERVDDGFVEFEFISDGDYIGENPKTRGAHCTSVDAAMIGRRADGKRVLVLLEWKYTESYTKKDMYIPQRSSRYDELITAPDSPFLGSAKPSVYEPFYQLMRQTLLASQCARHGDHGVSDYIHVHVVPEMNKELKDRVTSPELRGENIHDAWKRILRAPSKFVDTTPERLLSPVKETIDTRSFIDYLEKRYWE